MTPISAFGETKSAFGWSAGNPLVPPGKNPAVCYNLLYKVKAAIKFNIKIIKII
jgi:hypothetical protein